MIRQPLFFAFGLVLLVALVLWHRSNVAEKTSWRPKPPAPSWTPKPPAKPASKPPAPPPDPFSFSVTPAAFPAVFTEEQIQAVLDPQMKSIFHCAEKAIAQPQARSTKESAVNVHANLTLDREGTLRRADLVSLGSNTAWLLPLRACVAAAVNRWKFPAPAADRDALLVLTFVFYGAATTDEWPSKRTTQRNAKQNAEFTVHAFVEKNVSLVDPAPFRALVEAAAPRLSEVCRMEGLSPHPTAEATLLFEISPDGSVSKETVAVRGLDASAEALDAHLACVQREVGAWKFPALPTIDAKASVSHLLRWDEAEEQLDARASSESESSR
ncbi:MAG: hypothetical protein LBM75_03495 [Myxococcales bacterium]|jgi:hypothetical protein|nr:hypothetical protein [Myxococcales bacterium]